MTASPLRPIEERGLLALTRTNAYRDAVAAALDLIADELTTRDGYVSVSGGKDSAVVADLAWRVDHHVAMISWQDDDLDWPETTTHLERLRRERGWSLGIAHRRGNWDIIVRDGRSPYLYDYNHDRRLWGSAREAAPYDLVLLGLRAEESAGRAHNAAVRGKSYDVRRNHHQFGRARQHVCCPLQYWSGEMVLAYLLEREVPWHPVYYQTAMSSRLPWEMRVGRWFPFPHIVRMGYLPWLRHYGREYYDRLRDQWPETEQYG